MVRRIQRVYSPWRVALLGLVSVFLLNSACTSSLDEDENLARQEIDRVYPSWDLVTAKDLETEDFATWSAEHPGMAPGFAAGDYFGDGRKAWSALLKKEDERGMGVRLVILGMTPSGRFESYAIFTETPIESFPAIFTSEAGAYQVYIGDQVVPVPNEGVIYTHPSQEKQKLFYWTGEMFIDIEVGK